MSFGSVPNRLSFREGLTQSQEVEMREITAEELEQRADEFDAAIAATPQIDHFCSSSFWILPAWRAFLPAHQLWARECEQGFIALGVGTDHSLGTYLHPLEASWALACPFAGADVGGLVTHFIEQARGEMPAWNILFLSGIVPDSLHFDHLILGFRRHYSLGLGPSSVRRVASLSEGIDGFMSRRSSKFRANLRRVQRRADNQGIKLEYHRHIEPDTLSIALLDRALDLERLSWKGEADTGIIDGPMKAFYRDMLPRLARRDALRFLFVTLDGVDIAYCFGGVFNNTFRGLQMSYHDDFRDVSPGSLAQLAMIENLCEEGVQHYDLGTDMEYKERWAEEKRETVAVVVRR